MRKLLKRYAFAPDAFALAEFKDEAEALEIANDHAGRLDCGTGEGAASHERPFAASAMVASIAS